MANIRSKRSQTCTTLTTALSIFVIALSGTTCVPLSLGQDSSAP